MLTEIDLDDDITGALDHFRRSEGLELPQAVNELVRRGLFRPARRAAAPSSRPLGFKVDLTHVARSLDALGAGRARCHASSLRW
jgi:hypothetical protein